jgi:hypothetical protein
VQYRDLGLSFTLINKPHVQRDRIAIVPFVVEINLYIPYNSQPPKSASRTRAVASYNLPILSINLAYMKSSSPSKLCSMLIKELKLMMFSIPLKEPHNIVYYDSTGLQKPSLYSICFLIMPGVLFH